MANVAACDVSSLHSVSVCIRFLFISPNFNSPNLNHDPNPNPNLTLELEFGEMEFGELKGHRVYTVSSACVENAAVHIGREILGSREHEKLRAWELFLYIHFFQCIAILRDFTPHIGR